MIPINIVSSNKEVIGRLINQLANCDNKQEAQLVINKLLKYSDTRNDTKKIVIIIKKILSSKIEYQEYKNFADALQSNEEVDLVIEKIHQDYMEKILEQRKCRLDKIQNHIAELSKLTKKVSVSNNTVTKLFNRERKNYQEKQRNNKISEKIIEIIKESDFFCKAIIKHKLDACESERMIDIYQIATIAQRRLMSGQNIDSESFIRALQYMTTAKEYNKNNGQHLIKTFENVSAKKQLPEIFQQFAAKIKNLKLSIESLNTQSISKEKPHLYSSMPNINLVSNNDDNNAQETLSYQPWPNKRSQSYQQLSLLERSSIGTDHELRKNKYPLNDPNTNNKLSSQSLLSSDHNSYESLTKSFEYSSISNNGKYQADNKSLQSSASNASLPDIVALSDTDTKYHISYSSANDVTSGNNNVNPKLSTSKKKTEDKPYSSFLNNVHGGQFYASLNFNSTHHPNSESPISYC